MSSVKIRIPRRLTIKIPKFPKFDTGKKKCSLLLIMLFLFDSVFATTYTLTSDSGWSTSARSAYAYYGMSIKVINAVVLTELVKSDTCTANGFSIVRNGTYAIVGNGSFVGNKATVSITLSPDDYYIALWNSAGAWNGVYKDAGVSYPIANTTFNWTSRFAYDNPVWNHYLDVYVHNIINLTMSAPVYGNYSAVKVLDNSSTHLVRHGVEYNLNFTAYNSSDAYVLNMLNVTIPDIPISQANITAGTALPVTFNKTGVWNYTVIVQNFYNNSVNHTFYFYSYDGNVTFNTSASMAGKSVDYSFNRNDRTSVDDYTYTPFMHWDSESLSITGSNPYYTSKTMPTPTGYSESYTVIAGVNVTLGDYMLAVTNTTTQLVYKLNITNVAGNCKASDGWKPFLNLSMYDEQNTSAIMTEDFIGNYTGFIKTNFNFSTLGVYFNFTNYNVTNVTYCVQPNDTTINTPALIGAEYGSGGWATRTNYICNYYVNASTSYNRNLFNLKNSAPANTQTWSLKDIYNTVLPGHYLDLIKYYPGDPIGYRSVLVGKSGADGSTTQYVHYGSYYKAVVYDSNCNMVWTDSDPVQYYGTTRTITTTTTSTPFYTMYGAISTNSSYNNITRVYSAWVLDPSGYTNTLLLSAKYLNGTSQCSSTVSGSSSTNMLCTLSGNYTYNVVVSAYLTDGSYVVLITDIIDNTTSDKYDYGQVGVIITFFIVFSLSILGILTKNLGVVIILSYTGLLLSTMFNFLDVGWEVIIGLGGLVLVLVVKVMR